MHSPNLRARKAQANAARLESIVMVADAENLLVLLLQGLHPAPVASDPCI